MKHRNLSRSAGAFASALALASSAWAQAANPPAAAAAGATEEENVVTLSPFEVSGEADQGYSAATTLAGNRLNTELRDVGSAIQVVTSQFLKDTGAVNNETLLQYTTSTEVGSIQGNFAGLGDNASLNETGNFRNPSQNTRVRGLTNADNTRDYFLTNIPWDGYSVDRVDLQRGANSILFGQGSPAGIINNGTKQAGFRNSGEFEFRFDQYGSARASLDVNRELVDNELAVRIALLRDDQNYQQEPAYALSERGYGALRYEPAFLKKGTARTIIKANYEVGHVDSNRPRTLPPQDYITPWFYTGTYTGTYTGNRRIIPTTLPYPYTQAQLDAAAASAQYSGIGTPRTYPNLNRFGTNPHIAQNDNFYRPDLPMGLTRPGINGPATGGFGGFHNPTYNPWIAGGFGANQGGPVAYYSNSTLGRPSDFRVQEIPTPYGINSSGGRDRGLVFQFNRLIGINGYSDFARNAGLPFGGFGVYKNNSITDPSIFDFYNNLIDGPNKKEWQDFDVYNVSLAQTFMNDKFGFDLTYNKEDYEDGQMGLLQPGTQGLFIDINTHHTDGTPNGTGTWPNNIPYNDATVNPNFGRAFIQGNGTDNNSNVSKRESKRATAFLTHDFARENDGFIANLGRHTFTGLWAEDEQNTDNRNWWQYANLDPAYRTFIDGTGTWQSGGAPAITVYLGNTLRNATTAAGANLPRPTTTYTVPTSGTVRIFDSHWNAPNVNPAAEYFNAFPPPQEGRETIYPGQRQLTYSTQSENPANYVGWTNIPYNLTYADETPGGRDLLATSARLQRKLTTSKAFVWQAYLLNESLVGTFGIRKDRAQGWSRTVNNNTAATTEFPNPTYGLGHINLDPVNYRLPAVGSDLEETSKSYSGVVHLNRLPLIGQTIDRLPLRVSAFYNESTNFQPEAIRVDVYGVQIPLPKGETKDMGVILDTKDGKYSLRVTKYETIATNASSSGLTGTGHLGNAIAWTGNWINQYEYDFGINNQASGAQINAQVNNRPAGAAQPPGWTAQYRPGNPDWSPTNNLYNFDAALGPELEAAAIAAWRAWLPSVDPRYFAAWGIDLQAPFRQTNPFGYQASTPNGFALTEDSISKGYEFEFSAQPTRNWRVTFNASKTEAQRKNIGGANLAEFITNVEKVMNTAAGETRIWWGGAGNESAHYQWYNNVGGNWAQRKLQEGTNVPELREWRFNAITNYDFTEGRLKGLSIGGGLRWQDEIVIGYRPIQGATAQQVSFDIANPYMGPAETNIDLWAGYGRRIWRDIDWRIQLNIRNAFQDDELIPITAQPDGSGATYRIAPPQTWTITNTFRF